MVHSQKQEASSLGAGASVYVKKATDEPQGIHLDVLGLSAL